MEFSDIFFLPSTRIITTDWAHGGVDAIHVVIIIPVLVTVNSNSHQHIALLK